MLYRIMAVCVRSQATKALLQNGLAMAVVLWRTGGHHVTPREQSKEENSSDVYSLGALFPA